MAESVLLYGCTTWTLTERMVKKVDNNSTNTWNNTSKHCSCRPPYFPSHRPSKQDEKDILTSCWWIKDEFISEVLQWIIDHICCRIGRPSRTSIHPLCVVSGCSLEDLPGAMDDRGDKRERERERERERVCVWVCVRELRAIITTWWWWWYKNLKLQNLIGYSNVEIRNLPSKFRSPVYIYLQSAAQILAARV